VARDGSGNFTAGTITADLTGNAATATKLNSSRTFAVTGDVTGTINSDLTSGVSISTSIASGAIVNADVSSSAGIAGTKISPNFGSQDITTGGSLAGANLTTVSTRAADVVSVASYFNINGSTGDKNRFVLGCSSGIIRGIEIIAEKPGANNAHSLIFANSRGDSAPQEAARIDSSGRLLVGTSSAYTTSTGVTPQNQLAGLSNNACSSIIYNFQNDATTSNLTFAKSRGGSLGSQGLIADSDAIGNILFEASDGTQLRRAALISAAVDGTPGASDMPGRLVFSTTADGFPSPTERVRISSNGQLDTYSNSGSAAFVRTSAAAGTTQNIFVGNYGATSTANGTTSIAIRSNGNVVNTNNSYGSLSDIKLKENIVDANSQWDDLKALQVRNYNFKEGQTHTQIGLIAQEVELVSPGLVTESPDRDADGNDLGTVTKSVNYSVLYMKAVKALQEALERIEILETKVAVLESA
jgi:hypothetical protein